ncbi:DNA-binding protein [Rhodofomes roseus]|uniref:DNA-binding protein n=1 Tax=Rhodofomes roseus TaxID=34475 RepID=A0ABQ8KE52_9APHY|nr:DNA-binding protein [Rhodofomes roseus]KAH9835931.1 DNA-binding protein [Rhodofomes roseus]
MDNEAPLTFNQVVRGISEFIEVAIHTILYVRQVYPVDLFVRRKKYDTVVFQSRHPALNEYISGAVKAIEDELLLGALDKVVVVIKDKNEVALERFIFALHSLVNVESYNRDTSVEEAMTPRSLGQYFRSFLVKLSMIEAQLGQIQSTEDLSFAIVIELQDDRAPAASTDHDPPPWIPAVEGHTTAGASEKAELHMVRVVETGIINLALAVQESEEKLRLLSNEEAPSKGKDRAS